MGRSIHDGTPLSTQIVHLEQRVENLEDEARRRLQILFEAGVLKWLEQEIDAMAQQLFEGDVDERPRLRDLLRAYDLFTDMPQTMSDPRQVLTSVEDDIRNRAFPLRGDF